MDLFYSRRYYQNVRLFLSVTGLWPYYNQMILLLIRAAHFCVLFVFGNDQVLNIVKSENTLSTLIAAFPIMMTGLICAVKYFGCMINTDGVRVLLDELQCDWSAPKDEIEESILEEYAQRGRQYTRFLIIYIYTLTVTFLLSPLVPCSLDILVPLNKSRLLDHPLVMDYLVDQKRYFYLSFVRTYACVFVGMTVTIAVDGTFITIVLHICSLLQILSTKLQRMYDEFNKGVCDVNANYLLFRKMARAVMYHQRILRYVYLVNVVYAKSYLAQLFIVIVILSVILYCLFLAITVTKNIDEIILYGAHTIGLSCIVFLNVLPGQEMLDHSSDLFRNAYNGYWHVAPLSSQKLLLMIMQRSMKPCVITATNVLSSSYETFGVIVQTSLSYFTVLCSVR